MQTTFKSILLSALVSQAIASQPLEKRGVVAVVDGLTSVVDGALTDVGEIVDGATSLVGGVVTDVVDESGNLLNKREQQKRGVVAVVDGLTSVVDGALTDVGEIVDGATSLVGGVVTDVVDESGNLLNKREQQKRGVVAVVDGLTSVVDGALTDVGEIVDGATSLVGGVVTDVVDESGNLLNKREAEASTAAPSVESSNGGFRPLDLGSGVGGILVGQLFAVLAVSLYFF